MAAYMLQHLLTNAAQRQARKEAVNFAGRTITYLNLDTRSNQLATALTRLGVKKGDRVGLLFGKSIESIISLFGVLKAGATYVPIDPLTPIDRVKYIISNCEIKCLTASSDIATSVIPDLCKDLPLQSVLVSKGPTEELAGQCGSSDVISWEEIFQAESEDHQSCDISDDYPAYILHTSGSTGFPKGVAISHINSLSFVNMATDFFGINKNDRLCSHAPLHFDLSVFDIFVAIKSEATIVLIPQFLSMFPLKLAQYIDQSEISVWNSVSSVLSLLAQRGQLEELLFHSLRLVLFSGEILPLKYLRKLKAHMPTARFFNIYGQTEANSSMFYEINDIPHDDGWTIPIGKPFPNFDVFAINDNNKIISTPGEQGELFVRASTVAMGYWRDSERTSSSFVPDPRQSALPHKVYKTGDIVCLDNEMNYTFVGRKDHLIKSRGYRIEMNEIEITLNSFPRINQAAVVAVSDDVIGNRIIAYVSPIEDDKIREKELMDYCARSLPAYMIPEIIEFRKQLPMTSTGKIDRKSLAREAAAKNVRFIASQIQP
jgi:amino acid adenylation domain-containing protein